MKMLRICIKNSESGYILENKLYFQDRGIYFCLQSLPGSQGQIRRTEPSGFLEFSKRLTAVVGSKAAKNQFEKFLFGLLIAKPYSFIEIEHD
jgi:hypothetical protein